MIHNFEKRLKSLIKDLNKPLPEQKPKVKEEPKVNIIKREVIISKIKKKPEIKKEVPKEKINNALILKVSYDKDETTLYI